MEYRISQILRVHRAVTGQDQRELAGEIGIKQQALSQIERGMRPSLTAKKKDHRMDDVMTTEINLRKAVNFIAGIIGWGAIIGLPFVS